MPKVILQGYIEIPATDIELVRNELSTHVELSRQETGCLIFDLEEDTKNAHRFNVYEEFASQDAFDAHQERVRRSHWGSITKNAVRNYRMSTV